MGLIERISEPVYIDCVEKAGKNETVLCPICKTKLSRFPKTGSSYTITCETENCFKSTARGL